MAGTRVSLGFTHPHEANVTNDLMPRSTVSKLRCGAPMNWGTQRVLASREITVPNPNGMWYLKNEIGYFRSQHQHRVAFYSSSIALMSSELWSLEDRPQNTLRAPWRLSVQGGCEHWMLSIVRKRVSLGFTHPYGDNVTDNLMPRSTVSKLHCGAPMNWGTSQKWDRLF